MNLEPARLAGGGIGGRAGDGHPALGRDDHRVEQGEAMDGEVLSQLAVAAMVHGGWRLWGQLGAYIDG